MAQEAHIRSRQAITGGVALVCVGLAAGGAFAWSTVGKGMAPPGVGPASWRASSALGVATTDPVSRAVVAHTGIWALPAGEVLYYFADRDAEGAALKPTCVYEIAGQGDPPARWWSVGLYRDDRWIDNPTDRYAYSSTTVARSPAGGWRVLVARAPQTGDWLPMGPKPGRFVLTFRLYQPDPSLAKALGAAPLPPIRRLSCA